MNDTLWRHLPLSSQPDRVSIGFELVEQRRWQGVLDLWDPWEQGATSVSDLGRLQMLLALIHLAVEESARHIGPALDALDEVLDGAIGSLVDDSSVTASVLRPAAVALAVRWADEVWGTASLAAAGGRTPGAVTDLFARAKALSPAGA